MSVIDLKKGESLTTATTRNLWVLVKFSAVWCEPCQRLEPIFNSLMDKRRELAAVKIDINQQPELARQYAIRSVPSLLLLKQGKIVSQLSGLHNESQLQSWLDRHIQPALPEGE